MGRWLSELDCMHQFAAFCFHLVDMQCRINEHPVHTPNLWNCILQMTSHEVTVIGLSKAKMFRVLIIAFAFVALGYWLFNLDSNEIGASGQINSHLFDHGVGLASMVMGILGAVAISMKLLDKAPGLVLDSKGITVNSSVMAAGFVPWGDISGTQIRQIKNQKILYLLLKNPDKYIERCKPFRRVMLRAGQKMAASPVGINSNTLLIGFDELVALVESRLSSYQSNA
jgi:hypothetical protein